MSAGNANNNRKQRREAQAQGAASSRRKETSDLLQDNVKEPSGVDAAAGMDAEAP